MKRMSFLIFSMYVNSVLADASCIVYIEEKHAVDKAEIYLSEQQWSTQFLPKAINTTSHECSWAQQQCPSTQGHSSACDRQVRTD